MRILQLAPQFPFPQNDGGRIGLASTFKQLSKNAEVTFFCFSNDDIEKKYIKEAEQYGDVIIRKFNTKNTKSRIFKSIFDSLPLYLSKHYSNDVYEFLQKSVEKGKYDIVHADHTAMATYAAKLRENIGVKVGLRLHNVEYMIWERYYNELPFFKPQKYYIKLQSERLKREEAKLIEQMNISFPITEDDKCRAKEIAPNANLVVAGPGIDLENWTPNYEEEKNPFQLLHATTYNWRHNVDAILWFIRKVLPQIKKVIPQAKLVLLGKNPPEIFDSYKDLGVEVNGFVPDIKPYFNSSSVYIAPLFVGGGVRIKILEAMAMGLPVVASTISAEGILRKEGSGLVVKDDPDSFAKEIIKLMQNNSNARELGLKARKFILENYTYEKSIDVIYKSYQHLLENR